MEELRDQFNLEKANAARSSALAAEATSKVAELQAKLDAAQKTPRPPSSARPPELDELAPDEAEAAKAAAIKALGDKADIEPEATIEPEPEPSVDDTATLTISVLAARGLKKMDRGRKGKADPYVVLRCGGVEHKTEMVKNTLDPEWGASYQFVDIQLESGMLVAEVYDHDRLSMPDPMGQVFIRVKDMDGLRHWFTLQPMKGCDEPTGQLELECVVMAPTLAPRVEPVLEKEPVPASASKPKPEPEPDSGREREPEPELETEPDLAT